MDIAGNCNLMIHEGVRCQEKEECAICGLCLNHCLQHFLMDGIAHGKTVAPIKATGDVKFVREAA